MPRKPTLSLLMVSVVGSLILAGCGGSGAHHTYIVRSTSGVYITIDSPVALPSALVAEFRSGGTLVKHATGPQACSYAKTIKEAKGKYASLNGKTITVKANGSNPLMSLVCTSLKKTFNPSTGLSSAPIQEITSAIAPVALSAAGLGREAKHTGKPIYWAGPRKGFSYEVRRTTKGDVYLRYLPKGVHAGAPGASYLTVATYPFVGAFDVLKKLANGKGIAGPRGSIVYIRPNDPKSVLIAFPGLDYQIEVYDPRASIAASVAKSGRVRPVSP